MRRNSLWYSFVGTDFLQKIHGDGAQKIKDLFNEAGNKDKNTKGSIIFIDEIDAFGVARNEFNQKAKEILTTLLTELDGIKTKQNIQEAKPPIIIIAATNRFDVLDEALVRPGRFDYLVKVDLPDFQTRYDILKSYAKNKQFDSTIDFKQLAQETPGVSAAHLKAIINEAVILNINENTNSYHLIDMNTIVKAKDNVLLGFAQKNHKYDQKDKEIITTYQAAKTIISQIKKTHFLSSISLLPRLSDNFLFLSLQPNSSYWTFQNELFQRIIVILSGKAAEEVILGKLINQTCSDFKEALEQAQELTNFFSYKTISNKDKEELQKEILQRCYSDAKSLVKINQNLIKNLAKKLQTKDFFSVAEIKTFLNENKFQEDISTERNNQPKLLFYFAFSFILVLFFLLLLIIIIRIIFWFLDIKIFALLFANKYLLFLALNILSLIIVSIIIVFSWQSYLPFLPLFHQEGKNLTINELFFKIDQYEIKKMTYTTKNSWLEGFYQLVSIMDKNGDIFYFKLKPLFQNTFEQKFSNLKVKDFEVIEEIYFDYFNFFFKLIVFLSSLVFLLYGCLNIKRIRQQLKKPKENSFPYCSENHK
ncbi:AAA family ATPase [Candidatus Phytoplasma solani]|uniref:AAA family ATPase n=1 Tax=Candidatus Phytoplasma solani TaxID=69896 RepID=UPI0032DAA59E